MKNILTFRMSDNEILLHFIRGGIAGSTGLILSHPIDTIKSRIQKGVKVKWGFRNLYKGLLPPLFGVGLEKSIVFGTFETTKGFFQNSRFQNSRFQNSRLQNTSLQNKNVYIPICGAISGFASSFVVTPIERIKILRQTDKNFGNTRLSFNNLYKGLSMTFTREMPGFALYFSTYENLNDYCRDINTLVTPKHHFVFGAISGTVAWGFIYPQDMIKTRIQADSGSKSLKITDVCCNIFKENGIRGFFRGFHLALLRAIPLHAGTFTMFEFIKSKT